MTRQRLAAAASITIALLCLAWIILMATGVHLGWPE